MLVYASTQVDHGNIITYHVMLSRVGKSDRLVKAKVGMTANGYRASFGVTSILKLNVVIYNSVNILKVIEMYILNG